MDDRNYKITIKADALSGGKRKAVAGDNTQSDTEKSKNTIPETMSRLFAAVPVKSFATQIINHEVSLVQLRTGSNELQERANLINQATQKGLGILGASFVAGVPGMLYSATMTLANGAIDYMQKVHTLNMQNALENISIGMNYARAGANGSRRNNE